MRWGSAGNYRLVGGGEDGVGENKVSSLNIKFHHESTERSVRADKIQCRQPARRNRQKPARKDV